MKRGTRASLEANQRKRTEVMIGEETYTLREMNGTESDQFRSAVLGPDGKVDQVYLRARLVARCLIDDQTGARMYADDEIHQLSDALPSSALEKLFAEAQSLNGLDKDAAENAAKNSASGPAEGSTSA